MISIAEPNTEIIEQVRAICPCFSEIEDDALWLEITKALWAISAMLRWQIGVGSECHTLLNEQRNHVIEYDVDSCNNCEYYTVELPHKKINLIESISITRIYQGTATIYAVPIDPSPYINIADKVMLQSNTMVTNTRTGQEVTLGSLFENSACDNCVVIFIEIIYMAGYIELPECFYPLLCLLIGKSYCNGLNECNTLDKKAINAYVSEYTEGDITYRFDVPNNFYADTLDKLSTKAIWSQFGNYGNKLLNVYTYTYATN